MKDKHLHQNKDKSHIILPIEIKKREFLSKLVLSVNLVNHGHPVIIGDRSGCLRELSFLKRSIYLAKSLSVDLLPTFKKIQEQNGKILVLFEEGGYVLRENNKTEEIRSFYPKEMLPYVDYIMTYGRGYQDLLIEKYSELNYSNTYVSGNARFDLHKPKYFDLYKKEVDIIKKQYGEYILINTNFALANHVLGDEFIINEFKNSKDFTTDLIAYYSNMQKDQIKDLKDFVFMIRSVAFNFPQENIIVRPHPIENKMFYNAAFADVNNIYVEAGCSATPWIVGSQIVIHKDCTTGLESFFSKKPIISYQSSEDPNILWLPPLVSDVARSVDEMIIKIAQYLNKDQEFKIGIENDTIVAREVENMNSFTSDLFIQLIRDLKANGENNLDEVNDRIAKSKRMSLIYKLYKRKRNHLGWLKSKYFQKNIYSKSFEGLTISEVKRTFIKLREIEGLEFDFHIHKRGVNTFLIERKN